MGDLCGYFKALVRQWLEWVVYFNATDNSTGR